MAHNILGTRNNVKSFSRQDFSEFISANINTDRIVVSFVGNLPLKRITKLVNKHLATIPRQKFGSPREIFQHYKTDHVQKNKEIMQAHFSMGKPAFPIGHKMRIPFAMLANLLGGPGMTSRLNLALRERL